MNIFDICICQKIPAGNNYCKDIPNDDIWNLCETIDLRLSHDSSAPTRKTTVRVCWDSKYLYIRFDCEDHDIWATMINHDDDLFDEEVVEAFINPSCDLVRYYELEMNPLGVSFDALVVNPSGNRIDMTVDRSWDCNGWIYNVSVAGKVNSRDMKDKSWTVEWGIPFESISDRVPADGDIWRINFFRIDLTPVPEYSSWQPTCKIPADFHVPNAFGKLCFKE